MTDDAAPRFCPNCGNKIAPNDMFCSHCGTNFQSQSNYQSQSPPPAAAPLPPPLPPPRKKSHGGLIAGVIVLLVVVMLFALDIPQQMIEDSGGNIPGLTENTYTAGSGNYTYSWDYDGDTYTLKFNMSQQQYLNYANNPIYRRMPNGNLRAHGIDFITANDSLIKSMAQQMKTMGNEAELDKNEMGQMVLNFVQSIPYQYDNITYNVQDYWVFPLETLYHGKGDCEDKSFLYASIMIAMGYDCALLFFEDHVAVGLGLSYVANGEYYNNTGIHYYYCETTAKGWSIGEIPDEYYESYVIRIP
jgi:hypothetical protein